MPPPRPSARGLSILPGSVPPTQARGGATWGGGQQGQVSIPPGGSGSRVRQGCTQPGLASHQCSGWGLGPGAPQLPRVILKPHTGSLRPSGHLDAWGRSPRPPAPQLSPRRPGLGRALPSLLPWASVPREEEGVCLASGSGWGARCPGTPAGSVPRFQRQVRRPSPGRTGPTVHGGPGREVGGCLCPPGSRFKNKTSFQP